MSELASVTRKSATACNYADDTVIGLLDALHEAMTLARPGHDAARFADDLKRLGDGAAFVAQELSGKVDNRQHPAREPSLLPKSSRHAAE